MFESWARTRLTLFLCFVLVPASALAATASDSPEALLERADHFRTAWSEAVMILKVTMTRPEAEASVGRFEVAVKGDLARIRFLNPEDAGKLMVLRGEEAWLLMPRTRNPIKIPKSQRLLGGFSAVDVSRIRFAEDYTAVLERTDVWQGRPCVVLRLAARAGRRPSYPVVRLWIDDEQSLYRRAIFLLPSGRTAKDVTFDAYQTFGGIVSLQKMTIVDSLRTGTTVVEYESYQKKKLDDSLFDLRTARDE